MWLAAGRPSEHAGSIRVRCELAKAHGDGRRARHRRTARGGRRDGPRDGRHRERQTRPQRAADLGETSSMGEGRYRWFLAMGRVAEPEGDPLEAITLLDQAQQLYLPGFFPGVRPIPAVKARVWISRGDLSQAADWARERGVSATDDANYLNEFDHLTLVRLLIAQYRLDHDAAPAERGGRSVGKVGRRRRDLGSHRKPARDPHAAGPGTPRAGTPNASPSILGPSLGRGARARRLRAALPGRGRPHGRAAARGRAVGRRCWPRTSPARAPRGSRQRSDRVDSNARRAPSHRRRPRC